MFILNKIDFPIGSDDDSNSEITFGGRYETSFLGGGGEEGRGVETTKPTQLLFEVAQSKAPFINLCFSRVPSTNSQSLNPKMSWSKPAPAQAGLKCQWCMHSYQELVGAVALGWGQLYNCNFWTNNYLITVPSPYPYEMKTHVTSDFLTLLKKVYLYTLLTTKLSELIKTSSL